MTPHQTSHSWSVQSLAQSFEIEVEEVIIFNLLEGVFMPSWFCNNGDKNGNRCANQWCHSDRRTIWLSDLYLRIHTFNSRNCSGRKCTYRRHWRTSGKTNSTSATKLSENELSTASTDELKKCWRKLSMKKRMSVLPESGMSWISEKVINFFRIISAAQLIKNPISIYWCFTAPTGIGLCSYLKTNGNRIPEPTRNRQKRTRYLANC